MNAPQCAARLLHEENLLDRESALRRELGLESSDVGLRLRELSLVRAREPLPRLCQILPLPIRRF